MANFFKILGFLFCCWAFMGIKGCVDYNTKLNALGLERYAFQSVLVCPMTSEVVETDKEMTQITRRIGRINCPLSDFCGKGGHVIWDYIDVYPEYQAEYIRDKKLNKKPSTFEDTSIIIEEEDIISQSTTKNLRSMDELLGKSSKTKTLDDKIEIIIVVNGEVNRKFDVLVNGK